MSLKKITYGALFLLLQLVVSADIYAQTQEQVITGYLAKISNYIEWPEQDKNNDGVFKIVVVGNNDLCTVIQEAFQARKVKGKRAEVVCLKKYEEVSDIDMFVLATTKVKDLELALELCQKQNFLLITMSDGFAKRGAHINFYLRQEQTLHFEMNKERLDSNQFKVEFLLLEFAKVVDN